MLTKVKKTAGSPFIFNHTVYRDCNIIVKLDKLGKPLHTITDLTKFHGKFQRKKNMSLEICKFSPCLATIDNLPRRSASSKENTWDKL